MSSLTIIDNNLVAFGRQIKGYPSLEIRTLDFEPYKVIKHNMKDLNCFTRNSKHFFFGFDEGMMITNHSFSKTATLETKFGILCLQLLRDDIIIRGGDGG